MLCILYCAAILISVVVKLRQVSYQLVDTNIGGKTMTSQYEKNVLKRKAIISSVVKRIAWYPLVPLISQGPNFLYETDIYATHQVSFILGLLTAITATEGNKINLV